MNTAEIVKIVIPEGASRIEKFAAGELSKYIHAMADVKGDITLIAAPSPAIYLGCFPDWITIVEREKIASDLNELNKDSFAIRSEKNSVVIYGKTPRATLYGVYDYLRLLGVRWYFPGKEHEFIPNITLSITLIVFHGHLP